MITRTYRIYGLNGHRQRESFKKSYSFDSENACHVEVENSDKTGTNEYTVLRITGEDQTYIDYELMGQLEDGIFENSRWGRIEELD